MSKRVWIRLLVMVPIIVIVALAPDFIAWTQGGDRQEIPVGFVGVRQATPDEWQMTIAELGEQQKAKQIMVAWVGHDRSPTYAGVLVWFHDGDEPRLSYLPGQDESGNERFELLRAVDTGSAVIYAVHDPHTPAQQALQNLRSMTPGVGLPDGWIVLQAPASP